MPIIQSHLANPLPCSNDARVIQQIQPTIELLKNLDSEHPGILEERFINPHDYHNGLVFRSAVESIRGSYIASSTPGREKFVEDVLIMMKRSGIIKDYERLTSKQRWDFEIYPLDDNYLSIIEVKGGEGNSINISERTKIVKEFAIWSHLDGSIQHPPSKGAKAVVGRITNELSARGKQVDILFFKDKLCGTSARPCPKYPGLESKIGLDTCPDIFLFPQRVPTIEDPHPPLHTLETLQLPIRILDHFKVKKADFDKHLWYVDLHVQEVGDPSNNKYRRVYSIKHQETTISQGLGRPFSFNNQ